LVTPHSNIYQQCDQAQSSATRLQQHQVVDSAITVIAPPHQFVTMQMKKRRTAKGVIAKRRSTRIILLALIFCYSWFLAQQYLAHKKLHQNQHQEAATHIESIRIVKPDVVSFLEHEKQEYNPTEAGKIQIEFHDRDDRDDRSVCLSPERDAPWVLDGSCAKHPHLSKFSSIGPIRSCGFCGDNAAYLRELRDEISVKYQEKCKDLVVYGAALGLKYENMLRSKEVISGHISKVVKRHGTCFFQFVTDVNCTGNTLTGDGSQNLVVIDPGRMPYNSNRRNTKVIKFNPGLLFPWADRVIWQDAKLQKKDTKYLLPSDYLLHFNRTVERFGTCSSFMGLPHHKYAVQDAKEVNVMAHCDTIVSASWSRPSVSDNLNVLRTQCERSEKRLRNLLAQEARSEIFDKAPLVDTAFIVYDMRTPECKQFNGNLGCSLLDEIHCYSDRDQVSFPLVVANSELRLSPTLRTPGHDLRDRVYMNENDVPILHISKRSCHWYYQSFSRCVAPEGEEIGDSFNDENKAEEEKEIPRVAVIVAGTLQRFKFFKSTHDRLIKPITKTMSVDYYVSMTTAKAQAYRSGSGYADHLQPDPAFPTSTLDDSIDIEEYVRKSVGGDARIGALQIQESIAIDSEPMLKARREKALTDNPNEDPDQIFPMIDNRSADIARRTANGNRNLLKMHLAIQNLWKSALKWEAEEGFKYDYVFFLRDDILWLKNFDIMNIAKKEGDIFVSSCDARNLPLDPNELSDHILISRRNAADLFGNYYSTLFQTDIRGCMAHLPKKLTSGGKRGCSSEMLLKWVTEEQSIKATKFGSVSSICQVVRWIKYARSFFPF